MTFVKTPQVVDLYHGDVISDNFFHTAFNVGVKAVILKCTEDITFIDPAYAERVRRLLSVRELYAGDYHFWNLDCKDPIRQAESYLATSQLAGKSNTFKRIFDIETVPVTSEMVWQAKLREGMEYVKLHTGAYPIIYTYLDFYNQYLKERFPAGEYGYWISDYGNIAVETLAENCPFLLWQYTDAFRITGEGAYGSGGFDASCLPPNGRFQDMLMPSLMPATQGFAPYE